MPGLFCIGVDTDQWETVPAAHPCLVSSAMKLITPGVVDLVRQAKDGKFPGGNYFGGAGLAPFHDFDSKVPQDVKDLLDQDRSRPQGRLDQDRLRQATRRTTPAVKAPEGFKIGLVTDVGRVNDRSFNQSAWDGVQQAAKALGVAESDIKYIETQDAKDYADNMQQFIDAGYPVIVTVGFALGDATTAAAKANPDINFIGVDQFQGETLPNLTGLVFHEDQSGYLAGALAANLTKSGTIAAVLGTDLVPPVVAFNEGYIAGAKAVKPDIKVISTYHPGEISQAFVDPEWGAATAKQAIDQGADVIFGAGGQTGNGALQEVATHAGPLLHRRGHRPVGDGAGGASVSGLQRHEADHPRRRGSGEPGCRRQVPGRQLLRRRGAGPVPRFREQGAARRQGHAGEDRSRPQGWLDQDRLQPTISAERRRARGP